MTALLSAAEMADLWATYETALTDQCRLYAPLEGVDATVGTAKTWPTITATVSCSVIDGAGSATGGELFDNADLPNTRTIQLPRGTTVAQSYHVIPTTGRWAGRTFDVLTVTEAGSVGPATTCQCAEVTA